MFEGVVVVVDGFFFNKFKIICLKGGRVGRRGVRALRGRKDVGRTREFWMNVRGVDRAGAHRYAENVGSPDS